MKELKDISHAEVVKKVSKTGDDIVADLKGYQAHLLTMASCLVGEIGRLLIPTNLYDQDDFLVRAGSIEFYIQAIKNEMLSDGKKIKPNYDNRCIDFNVSDRLTIYAGKVFEIVKKSAIFGEELDWEKLRVTLFTFEEELKRYYSIMQVDQVTIKEFSKIKLAKRYPELNYSNELAKAKKDKES